MTCRGGGAAWQSGRGSPNSWPWTRKRFRTLGSPPLGASFQSTAGRSVLPRSARKRRFMPTPSSGKTLADREAESVAKIGGGVSGLNANAWDRLSDGGDPFVGHAFLSALEESGSVGLGTGWTPAPI